MSKSTTAKKLSLALAALLSIPLLGSAVVEGRTVTRCSLLGYRVGSEVLDATEAAERLASLLARVRAAVRVASCRLYDAGIHGSFRVRASETPFGLPQIVVTPRCEGIEFLRDELEARRAVAIACREAGLFPDVWAPDVFVTA